MYISRLSQEKQEVWCIFSCVKLTTNRYYTQIKSRHVSKITFFWYARRQKFGKPKKWGAWDRKQWLHRTAKTVYEYPCPSEMNHSISQFSWTDFGCPVQVLTFTCFQRPLNEINKSNSFLCLISWHLWWTFYQMLSKQRWHTSYSFWIFTPW